MEIGQSSFLNFFNNLANAKIDEDEKLRTIFCLSSEENKQLQESETFLENNEDYIRPLIPGIQTLILSYQSNLSDYAVARLFMTNKAINDYAI